MWFMLIRLRVASSFFLLRILQFASCFQTLPGSWGTPAPPPPCSQPKPHTLSEVGEQDLARVQRDRGAIITSVLINLFFFC